MYGSTPGSTCSVSTDRIARFSWAHDCGAGVRDRGADGSRAAKQAFASRNPIQFEILNGNAVLRWEYPPGSTMFFVWSTALLARLRRSAVQRSDDVRRSARARRTTTLP
jgi:hypothetical protein